MSKSGLQLPAYGVEIVEGLPGSGKSFYAVDYIITELLRNPRPVYTNVPLKWRVMRWYLRKVGGERLTNLLYPLTKDHVIRFMRRYAERAEFLKQFGDFRSDAAAVVADGFTGLDGGGESLRRVSREQALAAWFDHAGPDKVYGDDANWIPATALVIMDEVQDWFSSRDNVAGKETPDLQTYLSKHRHMGHKVLCITQERGRISKTIRVMADRFWTVRNMGDDRLMFGLRFRHIGIQAFGYFMFKGDQLEGRTNDNKRPIQNFVKIIGVGPWKWPEHQVLFRLYDSYTNLGSYKQIMRELRRSRELAGLPAEGLEVSNASAGGSDVADTESGGKSKGKGRGIGLRMFGLVGKAAALLLALFVGFGLGSARGGASGASSGTAVGAPGPGVVAGGSVSDPGGNIAWGQWQGSGPGFVVVDGRRVSKGQQIANGAVLADVRDDGSGSIWDRGGYVWVWRYGSAVPRLLGDARFVAAALGNAAGGMGGGGGVGVAGSGSGEALGPPSGLGEVRPGAGAAGR